MKAIKYSLAVLPILLFTACSYSDSALQYATEGSKRVDAGYAAKIEMTKHLTAYLAEANKGCGVKVEMINGVPVTTVKECVRLEDAMASVDKVEIVKPQQVKDMLDSMGDFAMKATNLVVPVSSIYFGYKTNKDNQAANVAIRQSDNNAQSSMWASYTDNFENTTTTTNTSDTSVTDKSVTDVTDKSLTDVSVTDKSTSVDKSVTDVKDVSVTTDKSVDTSITTVPSVSVDANGTVISK